jgi:hypothetical protein
MRASASLAAVALSALALAVWANQLPTPAPADAPSESFSAQRARADITWIGAEPHPTGSPANELVRKKLIARLEGLGLVVETQRVAGVVLPYDEPKGSTVTLENVIARVPGLDPTKPPLLLMCHYDSVPGSPGAADDGAGVAAVLEIARIFHGSRRTQRDLLLLFSDAEEPGLLGAVEFFKKHPLAKTVGAAVNLEARGGGGRAFLFETGAHSDELIRAFAHTARRISSSSFAAFVYDHMPNGTDFTIAKRLSIPGFNFAFIADPAQYHTAWSTPDALDLGSLQNIGDLVLASVACLDAPVPEARGGPLVWADLLGQRIIAYPAWAGWLLVLAIAASLAIASMRRAIRVRAAARGLGFALVLVVVAALALYAAFALGVLPESHHSYERLLLRCTRFELSLLLVSFGSGLIATRLCLKAADEDAMWIGLLSIGLIALVALQARVPQLTPPLAWPLVVAAVGAVGARSPLGSAWAALTATLSLAMTLSWAHGVYLGVGVFMPVALVIFVVTGSFAVLPLWARASRGSPRAGLIVLALGWVLALSIRY